MRSWQGRAGRIRKKTMDKMKRCKTAVSRLLALTLCAALCLCLAGCGDDDEPQTAPVKEGPRFTLAVAQSPDSFNPLLSEGGLAREFFTLCYDTLWQMDETGQPAPCLAQDWSLSSDRLTWTVRLDPEATFSDGVPVTSADVLFSYDLMRHNETPYTDYFAGISAIRCPDDHTVVITTDYVKGDMLYNPTPILPRHIWRDYEFEPATFDNADMIGSGPFVYDPASSGEEGWLFRAREDYAGGEAHLGEVYFALYGTVSGAARALSSGDADASFGLSDIQLTTLEGVPGVELIQAVLPGAECRMMAFNTREDMFFVKDSFRQMIEYCTNREWFLAMSSGGAGTLGSSFMSPGTNGFAQPDGLRQYDPNATLLSLQSIGYRDVDEDGYLEYGTREKELVITVCTSSQDEWAATAATILSSDLEGLGVRVNWRKTDNDVTSICGKRDTWDICMYSWKCSPVAAVAAAAFQRDLGALTGWQSTEMDGQMVMLRSAEGQDAIEGYARQVQQTVYNACPVIVLAYGADIQAVRSDIWTGYETQLSAGGLFGMGTNAVYMNVEPRETVG